MTGHITDERRLAGAVREWAAVRTGPSRLDRDRTQVARVLYSQGMVRHEIAVVLGIHWAQVDRVLEGKPARAVQR